MPIRGKTELEVLVWAACAFECEGSVTFSRGITKQGWYQLTPFISIANIDKRFIQFFESNFPKGHTLIEHPKKLSKQIIYRFKLYSTHCVEFLKLVQPYLKFKNDRAQCVLDYWERKDTLSRDEKDAYWIRLKALNRGESPAETKREDAETNLRSDSPTPKETLDNVTVS